uniref:Uncharacterized protein n=1 Tax=Rhizophora mucronata TaxID=61149 RepID=A0A2P2Q5V0_RHIMU
MGCIYILAIHCTTAKNLTR